MDQQHNVESHYRMQVIAQYRKTLKTLLYEGKLLSFSIEKSFLEIAVHSINTQILWL